MPKNNRGALAANARRRHPDPAAHELGRLSDEALLDVIGQGSADAYAVLFQRYRRPAQQLASHLSSAAVANDVVAESFALVVNQLHGGHGRGTSFRGTLFTTLRHEAARRAEDSGGIDRIVPFGAGPMESFDDDIARAAFESLPGRWQSVLWHVEVNGTKPRELAPILEMSASGASALARRAREGLRQAYLHQHSARTTRKRTSAACRDVRHRLARYVRSSATPRDIGVIDPHLDACGTCVGLYLELKEVNLHVGAVGGFLATILDPTAPPTHHGSVGRPTIASKSALVAMGSTAAVVATALTVMPGSSAEPEPVDVLQSRSFAASPPVSELTTELAGEFGPQRRDVKPPVVEELTEEREVGTAAPAEYGQEREAGAAVPAGVGEVGREVTAAVSAPIEAAEAGVSRAVAGGLQLVASLGEATGTGAGLPITVTVAGGRPPVTLTVDSSGAPVSIDASGFKAAMAVGLPPLDKLVDTIAEAAVRGTVTESPAVTTGADGAGLRKASRAPKAHKAHKAQKVTTTQKTSESAQARTVDDGWSSGTRGTGASAPHRGHQAEAAKAHQPRSYEASKAQQSSKTHRSTKSHTSIKSHPPTKAHKSTKSHKARKSTKRHKAGGEK